MAKRQKQDSEQEVAIERTSEVAEALRNSGGRYADILSTDLEVGMFIVTYARNGRAIAATQVKEIEWSRRREYCKVNDRYIYSFGGFVEVVQTNKTGMATARAAEAALVRLLFPELV